MQAIRNPVDAAKFAASVIRRHLPDPAYRVFLFGSRATRTAGERSDIDIGIEGPAPVPRAALAAIHDELEEAPTLYNRGRRFRARVGEISPGRRTADPAVTKAQSLRVDFEKAVARLDDALVCATGAGQCQKVR